MGKHAWRNPMKVVLVFEESEDDDLFALEVGELDRLRRWAPTIGRRLEIAQRKVRHWLANLDRRRRRRWSLSRGCCAALKRCSD